MVTVKQFYDQTIGKKFDLDGVPKSQPYQCADYFKQACKVMLGTHWATGGDGYVDNWWYYKKQVKGIQYIDKSQQLKNGDFVIWAHSKRDKSTPFNLSHVAMYYNGLMVGQNQPYPYVNAKYITSDKWNKRLGAIRFDEWNKEVNMHRSSNDLEQINYLGTEKSTRKIATSFHVYKKKNTEVKMQLKQFAYEGSDITAVQIKMDENIDLGLSYVGYLDWLCSLHNDWYEANGFEEIACCNAGYFEMATGKPVGAVMTDWQGKWARFNSSDCVPAKDNGYPTLTWNGTEMKLLNEYADAIDLSKYAWAVGVGQSLLIDGNIDYSIGKENGRFNDKNNTTAIGYNHQTKVLTLAINSKGTLNTTQRSKVMQSLGCDIAVQLDGGGSAQLEWLKKDLTVVEDEKEFTLEEKVAILWNEYKKNH